MRDLDQLKSILSQAKMVDLSHVMEQDIPIFPGQSKFFLNPWSRNPSTGHVGTNMITMNEHNGTHIDMTSHFIPGGLTTQTQDITAYHGICKTIKMSAKLDDYVVTAEDIIGWEKDHCEINEGDIVLFHYGWDKYWSTDPDSRRYLSGYPGLGQEACRYLISKKVKMVGCDPISIDNPKQENAPAHNTLLPAGVLIIENLNNLSLLPDEAYFMCLPMNIKGSTASPIRPVAFIL